ncbi:MAG: STAS domain-containing protein [Eubacteriales bacterium]|nr:STAS domain-containing protein [Eubacteriales bacterium]
MSSELEITENKLESGTEVLLTGEVDIYTSQNLKEKLYNILDSTKQDVIINCSSLSYIDSTGLGILVGALKKAKQMGCNITISNLKDNIKKLFLITGLDKLFIIEG